MFFFFFFSSDCSLFLFSAIVELELFLYLAAWAKEEASSISLEAIASRCWRPSLLGGSSWHSFSQRLVTLSGDQRSGDTEGERNGDS